MTLLLTNASGCNSCYCKDWCIARNFDNADGSFNWAATERNKPGSQGWRAATDGTNWYVAAGSSVIKLTASGTQVWEYSNLGGPVTAVTADGSHVWATFDGHAAGVFSPATPSFLVRLTQLSGVVDGFAYTSPLMTYVYSPTDLVSDGLGGVFMSAEILASTPGILRYNSSLASSGIGCNRSVEAIDYDGTSLYAVGGDCTISDSETGCDYSANVISYTSNGELVMAAKRLNYPKSVVENDGKIFIGYVSNIPTTSGAWLPAQSGIYSATLQKWNATTFVCEGEIGVGQSGVLRPESVTDLATDGTDIFAIANKFLYSIDPTALTINWCQKNEGTEGSPAVTISGIFNGVAANSSRVLAVGRAVPCTHSNNNNCALIDFEMCGFCSDACCEQRCGERGPFGGYLTSSCGCDEIWCEFTQPGGGTGCLTCLAAGTINWLGGDLNGDGNREWTGTQTWCPSTPDGVLIITAIYDCDTGWSFSGVVNVSGEDTYDLGAGTVSSSWCTDDAPEGEPQMPWFRGYWTITAEEAAAHPEIFGDCNEESCLGVGDAGCPSEIICTNCPATMTVTPSNGGTATVTQGVSPNECNYTGSLLNTHPCYTAPFDNTVQVIFDEATDTAQVIIGFDEYGPGPASCDSAFTLSLTLDVLGCNTGGSVTVTP
jgi:hypothetical protein